MSCTYPSTKLDLMICSQVPLTLGRNLAFSLCCQKSPVPCSQLGPVPTSVSAHETTSEVEGDDGICASQPHQREYHSEGKKKKKKIIIEIFTFTTFLLCISLMRILGFKVFTFGVFHRQNPIILKGIYAIRNFMSG